jgi:hypothetical protein
MPFVVAVSMEPRYIEILFQILHLIHWYEAIQLKGVIKLNYVVYIYLNNINMFYAYAYAT